MKLINKNIIYGKNAGFTLIELVIATTILSMVMASVYFAFNTSIRTWKALEADIIPDQQARNAMDMMTRLIHGMHSPASHLFRGKEEELFFLTIAAPMDPYDGPGARLMAIRFSVLDGSLIREEARVLIPLSLSYDEETICDYVNSLKWEPYIEIASNVAQIHFNYIWYPTRGQEGFDDKRATDPREMTLKTDVLMRCTTPHGIEIALTLFDKDTGEVKTVYENLVRLNFLASKYDDECEGTNCG